MSQTTNTTKRCAEEYTVKRGDSFYLIAHKLGVPLRFVDNDGAELLHAVLGDESGIG